MECKHKLLAMDLDGTLLNDEKIISNKNKEAINKCIEKGVKIVVSSGRSMEDIKEFADEVSATKYCSGAHGAIIFDSNEMKIIQETLLNSETALEIIKEIEFIEDIAVMVFAKNNTYTHRLTDYLKIFLENKAIRLTKVEDLKQVNEDIIKILVRGERLFLEKLKVKLNYLEDKCKIFFSEENLLEFMSLEANKGYSLEKIAELYNIDMKYTVSVGDNFNDLEMIEKAGIGVAVNNAVCELQQIADYVTINDNNNDAIAEIIEKYFI